MKTTWVLVVAIAALSIGLVAGRVTAEEKGGMQMPTKGPQHEAFAKAVGEWEAHMSWWMPGATEPVTQTDSCECKTMLNGWFMKMNYTGSWQGQPWHGKLIVGYDQVRKEHVHVWLSDQGSDMSISRGNKNADGCLVMKGEMVDHMSGGKIRPAETEWKHKDENTKVMTMYWADGGKRAETPMMQITYKRKAAQ